MPGAASFSASTITMEEPTAPALGTRRRAPPQDRAQTPTLLVVRDRQATDRGATDERMTGEMLSSRLRHLASGDRHRAERVIAEHALRQGHRARHENGARFAASVLSGSGPGIAIQTFHAAAETGAIVLLAQRRDAQVRGRKLGRSPHEPALAILERPLEAPAPRRRVDESSEEDRAVTLGQDDRLVLCNRTTRRLRQRRHAEAGELAPSARSRPSSARRPETRAVLPEASCRTSLAWP